MAPGFLKQSGAAAALFFVLSGPAWAACGTISSCPAVSTPLAGTEILPIVQGGVTKKITASQLVAGVANPVTGPSTSVVGDIAVFNNTTGNLLADSGKSTSSFLTSTLTSAHLFVGNGSNVATSAALSGDCSLANTGTITCTKSSGTAFGTAAFQNTGTSGANIGFLNGNNTNSGTSNFTGTFEVNGNAMTFPSGPGTIPCLSCIQNWTGANGFNNNALQLQGGSSGAIILNAPSAAGSNTITFPAATGTVALTSTNQPITDIGCIIDGGGATITTGQQCRFIIDFACTINQVTLLADQSGSITVDIWKVAYGSYPPTISNTITASDTPTISSAQKAQDSTLTGWTTSVNAGDTFIFNVKGSVTSVQQVSAQLKCTKS